MTRNYLLKLKTSNASFGSEEPSKGGGKEKEGAEGEKKEENKTQKFYPYWSTKKSSTIKHKQVLYSHLTVLNKAQMLGN